jgi:hypothetical protein
MNAWRSCWEVMADPSGSRLAARRPAGGAPPPGGPLVDRLQPQLCDVAGTGRARIRQQHDELFAAEARRIAQDAIDSATSIALRRTLAT